MAIAEATINAKHSRREHARAVAVPIETLPGSLPQARVPGDVDVSEVVASQFNNIEVLSLDDLAVDAIWRDSYALTGTLRTFVGANAVVKAWKETSALHKPTAFKVTPHTARVIRHSPDISWVQAHFTFETQGCLPLKICSGFVSLIPSETGQWKIWMLRTILENFTRCQSPDVLEPPQSISSNSHDKSSSPFDCVVVGGGQAGLSTGGRCQALGLSYLIVDKNPNVGDSWRLRYDSTKLHTLREYAHLPFGRTFGQEYPEFLTKDHLADGYQKWVRDHEINIWQSTKLLSSTWDDHTRIWTCHLWRNGREETVLTYHLVFAVGPGGQTPTMPKYKNQEKFNGVVLHSVDYHNSLAWKGLRGIVIGTANTGHDVAEDMVDAGLSSVTMVQRGQTYVLPVEYYMKVMQPLYNDKVPTEMADRSSFSNPVAVTRLLSRLHLHRMAEEDIERFRALARAGFKVETFGDIASAQYERLGGHYMDVGCSAKIAKGLIKMKSDALPTHYTPDGLAFSDGTEIEADVVVFTTGFVGNLREMVGSIVGPEIQDQLEDFCGVDREGEILGAWKPTGHPGIWYIGGAIGQARYWSRFIALQIQAARMGHPLKVYEKMPNAERHSSVNANGKLLGRGVSASLTSTTAPIAQRDFCDVAGSAKVGTTAHSARNDFYGDMKADGWKAK